MAKKSIQLLSYFFIIIKTIFLEILKVSKTSTSMLNVIQMDK